MGNRTLVTLAVALLVAAGLFQSFFSVDQRERAMLFQFGQIKRTDFSPGLHFKVPFMQTVRKFDGRVLNVESETENFLTLEKKNVKVDFFVKWRIADTLTYYRATGGQEGIGGDRLQSIINRGLRDEFGARTIRQAVSGDRDEIRVALQESTRKNVRELGIEIVDIRVSRIDLPDEVSESVYERMRAERTRTAADLRAKGAEEAEKIRAEADREAVTIVANAYKQAEQTRGEGDARAAEVYAAAFGQDPEFYSFYRSLDLYREAWSGKQDVLILEPKGELFRYFGNPGLAR